MRMNSIQTPEEYLEDLHLMGQDLLEAVHALTEVYKMTAKQAKHALKHHPRWKHHDDDELACALSQWADDGGVIYVELDDCDDPYSSK